MTCHSPMWRLNQMQAAFLRALVVWASRGGRAGPIALPVGRVDPDELWRVLVTIKCSYAGNGVKNG